MVKRWRKGNKTIRNINSAIWLLGIIAAMVVLGSQRKDNKLSIPWFPVCARSFNLKSSTWNEGPLLGTLRNGERCW